MDTRWIPAQPGMALADVDTPALLLDLDLFEHNLQAVLAAAAAAGVRVRPHAKSHKCVQIARRQIAAGAVGICCQKTSEAAAFLAGGVADVLITNEVVGARKLAALARLAAAYPAARLGVCVEDAAVARELGAACLAAAARLDVYVEADVGQGRAGVVDADELIGVARAVVAQPRLRFMGLHAYHGAAQHVRRVDERRQTIAAAAQKAAALRAALHAADLPCEIVTGAGTGSFVYEAASGVYNEVQPGSFALMDADYARNEADPSAPQFAQALFVLAGVMSIRGERVTLDAGLKALAVDSGPPVPAGPGWTVGAVSDEHTVLRRSGDGPPPKLGDKLLLIPGHCDPTVNLHDWIVAVRGERVEAVWSVDARGALF
jgi:D-serine deaminase-like pyridoxal phosphate-dependent protein